LSSFIVFHQKTIPNLLSFLEELLGKMKGFKILHSLFYANLCKHACKGITPNVFIKLYLKTMIESGLNHYFIKYFSPIPKGLIPKPQIHILCYANKTPCQSMKFYLKIMFGYENLSYYWFKTLL
jgi:hypothetical protein